MVIFNRGLIEQQGTPTDIIRHPRTPFIMKFVGDTNIVPANCVLVRRSRFQTSKSKVMFRPSDVQVFKDYVAGEHEHMVTPAVVADKFNLGWFVRYVLRFDDDVEIELQVPREQDDRRYNMEPGRRIYLYVRPQAMMGFDPSEIETAPVVS